MRLECTAVCGDHVQFMGKNVVDDGLLHSGMRTGIFWCLLRQGQNVGDGSGNGRIEQTFIGCSRGNIAVATTISYRHHRDQISLVAVSVHIDDASTKLMNCLPASQQKEDGRGAGVSVQAAFEPS